MAAERRERAVEFVAAHLTEHHYELPSRERTSYGEGTPYREGWSSYRAAAVSILSRDRRLDTVATEPLAAREERAVTAAHWTVRA